MSEPNKKNDYIFHLTLFAILIVIAIIRHFFM